MKMIKKIATLTAITLTASGMVGSAMAAMPLPMGWYIEGDAGGSKSSNKNYGSGTSRGTNTGFAWNADAGYKFMPYLGVEIGYTKYAQTKVKGTGGVQVAKDSDSSYQAAAKGILPVSTSGVEFFAKVGITRINSHVTLTNPSDPVAANVATGSKNSTGLYLGVGADYAFMPNLTGILQWARAKGNNSTGNLDLYSVGIAYMVE
jgi:opacity protein-like surface antigen